MVYKWYILPIGWFIFRFILRFHLKFQSCSRGLLRSKQETPPPSNHEENLWLTVIKVEPTWWSLRNRFKKGLWLTSTHAGVQICRDETTHISGEKNKKSTLCSEKSGSQQEVVDSSLSSSLSETLVMMFELCIQNPRDGSRFHHINEITLSSSLATLGLSKISDNNKIGWTCIPFRNFMTTSTCRNPIFFWWVGCNFDANLFLTHQKYGFLLGKLVADPYPAATAAIYQCPSHGPLQTYHLEALDPSLQNLWVFFVTNNCWSHMNWEIQVFVANL